MAGQGHPQVGGHDAAHTGRKRPLQDHDLAYPPVPAQRLADGLGGERPEGADAENADAHVVGPQFVHGVLERADHRAERHDHRLGVVETVAADQATGVAAERLPEFAHHLRDELEGL